MCSLLKTLFSFYPYLRLYRVISYLYASPSCAFHPPFRPLTRRVHMPRRHRRPGELLGSAIGQCGRVGVRGGRRAHRWLSTKVPLQTEGSLEQMVPPAAQLTSNNSGAKSLTVRPPPPQTAARLLAHRSLQTMRLPHLPLPLSMSTREDITASGEYINSCKSYRRWV